MKFYRYRIIEYATHNDDYEYIAAPKYPDPRIVLEEFVPVRETPKGYWIIPETMTQFKDPKILKKCEKWVSKTAFRRYAYPTTEEALNNFVKRTERRIKILKYQLMQSQIAFGNAQLMQQTSKPF